MDKKPSRSNPFDTQGARQLVLTLAVTSTIGFWAIFAKGAREASAWSDETGSTADDAAVVQNDNRLVLELPPMPTLIPPLTAAEMAANPRAAAAPVTAGFQAPVTLPEPSLTFGAPSNTAAPKQKKVFIGGGSSTNRKKTGGSGGSVTSTRSSR